MADNETIADIIVEMRKLAHEFEDYGGVSIPAMLLDFSDRLEAAHKRERGDAAKLCEALKSIWKEVYLYAIEEDKQDFAHLHEAMLEDPPEYKDLRNSFFAIAHLVDAALAAPPRNCDLPKVAEDPWRAWLDDESNWEGGNPKLEIHEWLLATAIEKEGENNG